MAENTSRLRVEVDGSAAISGIDRISRAFQRLQATMQATGRGFVRLSSTGLSAMSRLAGAGPLLLRMFSSIGSAVVRLSRLFVSAFKTISTVVLAAAAGFTIFARSVTETGNHINKFVNTLVILTGNTRSAIIELETLYNLSNKLGVSFDAAATPFTKFAAAAAGTLTESSIRDVFESFATVGAALQLTQSEVQGVFLALQQIASKGVVSMEELRLQLAERVPGAMRLAAASMNMSMEEFEKAVTERSINAGRFLENFAAKLKETYGEAAKLASTRLFADIQRLGNEFLKFKNIIFQSGFGEGLQNLVRSATDFLSNNPELAQALGQFSRSIFDNVSDFINTLTPTTVINAINQIISAFESLINAINTLSFHLRKMFDDDFKSATGKVENYVNAINRLIKERNEEVSKLNSGRIIENNILSRDVNRPMTNAEIVESSEKIDRLNNDIAIMTDSLIGARLEARELGIAFEEFPDGLDGPIRMPMGPAEVTLPRVQPIDPNNRPSLGMNQPDVIGGVSSLSTAMDQAFTALNKDMPEFLQAIIDGRIRDGIEEIHLVSSDLNFTMAKQDEIFKSLSETQNELDALRLNENSGLSPNDKAVKLNELTAKLIELMKQYNELEETRIELKEKLGKLLDEEQRKLEKIKTFQQELEETFQTTREVMIGILKKTEDAFVELVATGKASFSELAEAIIKDLIRMAIQAFLVRYILGPLLQPISDSLGNSLGGSFSSPTAPVSTTPPANIPPPPGGHQGGVFHTGGIVDSNSVFNRLNQHERVIVVKRGEGIFTPDQMRALAPVADINSAIARTNFNPVINVSPVMDNGSRNQTKVEVINNSGVDARVETTTQPDGSELTRIIVGAVATDIARDGQLTQMLKGKFGLRNTTGIR